MLELVIKNLIGKMKLGSFCTSIQSGIGDFDLSVEGVGKVKCPIMPKMAKSLISVAKPASFGRKDKTIYDPSVRHVWEIGAKQVTIAEPYWDQKLNSVLETVHKDLNMPKGSRLSAHLHNLLVYERGQFFASHQDSEKYEGMLATLVVLLPSHFSGGSLKIDQHGDKRTFDADDGTRSHITFIAFYADCHHEITKVTAGYRVALTYNLVLEGAPELHPKAKTTALTRHIKDYFAAKNVASSYRRDQPRWLVYLFDHQYTQKSFQWNALKGSDRDTAAQLLSAAKDLDLVPHLALADIHEAWTAEADSDYGRRYRYRDDSGDDEGDDEDEVNKYAENVEVDDLILQEVTLCHWLDQDGQTFHGGPTSVRDEMVCWSKANDEFKPIKAEYEGYMGNYGNTVDKWYHRAAIILWPKDIDIVSRFEVTPNAVLYTITKQLVDDPVKGRANLKELLPRFHDRELRDLKQSRLLCEIAFRVGDEQLAQTILQHMGLGFVQANSLPSILPLLNSYGEDWFIEQLKLWSKKDRYSPQRINDLENLVRELHIKYSKLTTWLLGYQRERIIETDRARQAFGRKHNQDGEAKYVKELATFLRAASAYSQEVAVVVDHILEHSDLYSSIGIAQLIFSLQETAFPKQHRDKLIVSARERLSDILSNSRANNDWSIRTALPCKCKDCLVLKEFLTGSTRRTYVWPLAKDRRQHIHQIIDGSGLPVTHETLRQGSPQKLVLEKTEELFAMEKSEKQAAAKMLKDLETY